VLSVIRAKSYEQAIEFAKHVAFGLTSSIYTMTRGVYSSASASKTGMSTVNSPTMAGNADSFWWNEIVRHRASANKGRPPWTFYTGREGHLYRLHGRGSNQQVMKGLGERGLKPRLHFDPNISDPEHFRPRTFKAEHFGAHHHFVTTKM